MSKAVSKNTHWLPKTGSYSVRLNRRGDIGEPAPAHAKDATYEANEHRRQGLVNALREAEKERAAAITASKTINSLRAQGNYAKSLELENRCAETRRRVAELQNELRLVNAAMTIDGRSPTKHAFEKCFVDVAHVLLDSKTFMRISNEAARQMHANKS